MVTFAARKGSFDTGEFRSLVWACNFFLQYSESDYFSCDSCDSVMMSNVDRVSYRVHLQFWEHVYISGVFCV